MDYKEAYYSLIERLKEAKEDADVCDERYCCVIDGLIQEPEENEDERIRETLIDYFKTYKKQEECGIKTFFGIPTDNVLAWLEKQGKKPQGKSALEAIEEEKVDNANKVEPPSFDEAQRTPAIKKCREHKFEKGDWINGYYTNYKVTAINSEGYVVEDTDGNKLNILFENEKFHHLFTIADAKEGDVLATDDCVFIFKKLNARGKPVCYCHYDDELGFKVDINSYLATGSEIYPATIERRNILMKAMADAGYEWDSEKKELKEIEQEPAWSVKDEAGLGDALWAIQQARTIAKDETDMGNLWYAENWLNSLKERLQKS